jgi:hypothetical protein
MAAKDNKTTTSAKEQKGETFLLRLTPDLRKDLDAFRTEVKAKSLQTLILQFIVEGMEKDDFTPTQLFSKDLHARQLGMAIGQGVESEIGHTRAPGDRKGLQTRPWNPHALVGAHERVLDELESQKLTSFAALMDPALMSYRLLLDFCFQDPNRRDSESLIRDFSSGLWFSAEQAMERKKWNFAQILLLQACELDRENTDLGLAAGVYLLKRLMMRGWLRTKISDRVTNGTLMEILPNFDEDKSRSNVEATDVVTDETEWAMVDNAYELLYRGLHLEPWELNTPWRNITQGHGGFGKLSCWRDLAFIIRWAASPEKNDLPVEHEEELLARITASFRGWEQSFRMTREQSALQREWSGLLDALEVFWWLGYRKEAFEFAREVRNFSSDKEGISRFSRIVSWNPETEWSGYFPDGGPSFIENKDVPFGYVDDYQFDPNIRELPYPFRANLA